ncbi:MAG: 3'-5' exonuclease [Muribaculum sp.]|nr:3'-5' exonuclease [Muribaculum sp.]
MTDSYISIDLETTGLNPKWDKIIEIGALKVQKGRITDRFSTFVNPGRKLEERIVELTGIRDEDLADAPYPEDVLEEAFTFLEDLPLLGHSILFDYSFLKKVAVDRKIPFEKDGVDTLKIARRYLAELEHRNLDYLCRYYGIPHRAHRALEDAEATMLLYGKLGELFGEQDEGALFVPSPLRYQVKRDTPATKAQKEQLYRLLKQHKIVLNADVERLTRREASRIIDQIRSRRLVPSNDGESVPG